MATTNSARKILKSLLSNTPSCDSASSVEVRTATSESNSVSDASDVRGVIAMDGLLKYEDLIALLSCSLCQKFCGKSIVQCRKGVIVVVDWCVVKIRYLPTTQTQVNVKTKPTQFLMEFYYLNLPNLSDFLHFWTIGCLIMITYLESICLI